MAYNDPTWVADDVYASLNMERQVRGEGGKELSHAQLSRKIFEENAPLAAARIAHLAAYSPSDSVALRAATYITDRVLGKIGEDSEVADPLEAFLADMLKSAEQHANKRT